MLKFVNLTLGFILVVAIALVFVMKAGPSLMKGQIESEISSRTGIATKIASLKIVQVWPFTVLLRGIKMDGPLFLARINQLQAAVSYSQRRWIVHVQVEEPQVRVRETASTTAQPMPIKPTANVREQARDSNIDLDIFVTGGRISMPETTQMLAEQIELKFSKKGLLNLTTPGSLQLRTQVQAVLLGLNVRWPVTLSMPDLISDGILFRTAGSNLIVGGISVRFNGASNLSEQTHNWRVQAEVPKIEELPQPPNLLPGSNFRGQVHIGGDVQVNRGVLKAGGDVILKGLSADLKVNQQGLEIEGPVRANLTTEFKYDQMFRLHHFVSDIDFTDARVNFKELFAKTQQVPCKFTARGASPGQDLEIQGLGFEVAQVKGTLSGRVTPKGDFPANLMLHISETSLNGLERVILPLKTSPVKGRMELRGSLTGPLKDWQKARLQLDSLRVIGLSGNLDWKNLDGTIALSGPITGSVAASGLYDKGQLNSANGAGSLNLLNLDIQAKDFYRKSAGQPFALDFDANTDAMESVRLKKFQFRTDWGSMDFVGTVQKPSEPVFDLDLKTPHLSLTGLRKTSPLMKDLLPEGEMSGQVHLKGVYRTAESAWYKQNIRVSGQVNVNLPEYKLKEEPKSDTSVGAKSGPATMPPPTDGFLPDGLLTKSLDMSVKLQIGKLIKPGLTVQSLLTQGLIKNGVFSGLVQIGDLFGGQVKLTQLNVPLLDPAPVIKGSAGFSNIKIEDGILFTKPDLKDFAFGRIGGQVGFSTVMPGDPEFMKKLSVKGLAKAEPLTLNSVKVGDMLNDMVRKVPGLSNKKVKTDPLKGWAQLNFQLDDQVMELPQFRAMDVDGSELVANGKIQLSSMTAQLKGMFYWKNPSVKGCLLEGNRDAQGRMQIPIALEGALMQPQMSLVGNLMAQLGSKALNCEGKKFVDKLKSDKNLQNEVKDKLKSLFGQ